MKKTIALFIALSAAIAFAQDQDVLAPQTSAAADGYGERIWGSDESQALEDAEWEKVVRSCRHWVNNRENSQIKPDAQNISCQLRTNGIEQVGVIEKEKTFVTDSMLIAGASNGKGEQRSESAQQKSSVEKVAVICPVMQQIERRFRFDFSISCEDVARSNYSSKIQLCEDFWLSKFAHLEGEERAKCMEPYFVSKTAHGEKLIDCSSK